ncbi:MAG: GbsR/MarR family transcriptional regulator [Deltaproteobacteria bacterium]|nr:GbsR/MarR family transcriptional regulator [Deltaproteobacteria bacterium]
MSEGNLSSAQSRFIVHWGEMGDRWGINRTIAQIHALLYLSPRPLNAEEIVSTLQVARSNVSNSLRELQGWKIVRRVHVFGDRRDHFETDKDVWKLFRTILDERKTREIDPTISMLRDCLETVSREGDDEETQQRLEEMLRFFEITSSWYDAVGKLPLDSLMRFLKLGDRLPQALKGRSSKTETKT